MSFTGGSSPHVLRDHALLADGERGAVLGPEGDVAWLCVPGWDGDAVFAGLLGGGGTYALCPVERYVWGGAYEDGTLTWRTRWTTADTVTECRQALAVPVDPRCAVLLRRVEALDGDVVLDVVLDLRGRNGAHRSRDVRRDDAGTWSGRTSSGLRWRWQGAPDAHLDDDGALRARLHVPSGSALDLVLEVGDALPDRPTRAEAAWSATDADWRGAVPDMTHTVAPRDARTAYAVLRGMTSSAHGMVAAATTSLPESVQGDKDYDYRYAWIRDQCYAGAADAAVGGTVLLGHAVEFVTARLLADGDRLKPAYTVSGGPVPPETDMGLVGYPGSRTVQGNQARSQFQLDSFGEVLTLLAAGSAADLLTAEHWRAVDVAVAAIAEHWDDDEAGLWEVEPDWWVHSRLACVSGLRAVAKVQRAADAPALLSLAEKIMARTGAIGVHPDGFWRRSPGTDHTDAALLMGAIRGGVAVDDPRTVATIEAVRRTLTEDGYVYRFRHDGRPLGESEGAFLLCGFMMALATHQQGDTVQAFRWFERNRAAAGSPGLFCEEFDVRQRQLRGNLPQAFVHALMLETSVALAR